MVNVVNLVGYIKSDMINAYSNYYKFTLAVERDSGVTDYIPVIISDKLLSQKININDYVYIKGVYKSYKKNKKLIVYVFVNEIKILNYTDNVNDVFLEGVICQPPTLRYTPNRRKISDVLLRVGNYCIPCICWGKTAVFFKRLPVGTNIRVAGRIQSRAYVKNNNEYITYELSVSLYEEL